MDAGASFSKELPPGGGLGPQIPLEAVQKQLQAELSEAMQKEDLARVKVLISKKVNPNFFDSHGYSPLKWAARRGYVEIVRDLIQQGADVNARNIAGDTALEQASGRGHLEVVKELILHRVNVDDTDNYGRTPLTLAAGNGHADVVKELLSHGAKINQQDCAGDTALHKAAESGNVAVVEALLAIGADCNLQDKYGLTPLIMAAESGHVEIVEKLLLGGAKVDIQSNHGNTALESAAALGRVDACMKLIEAGAKTSARGKAILEAEFLLAAKHGRLDEVKKMAGKVVDLNRATQKGYTALTFAAERGEVALVKLLLSLGAKVDPVTSWGSTPLMFAAQNSHEQVAETLISHQAAINAENSVGATPLAYAIKSHLRGMVRLLLSKGADCNHANKTGNRPLILAAREGDEEMAKALVKKGANVNAQDNDGWNALMVAAVNGQTKVIELILNSGADVTAIMKSGETVLDLLYATHPPRWQLHCYLIKTHLATKKGTPAAHYLPTKLLAHAFQLRGKSTIGPQTIEWEGSYREIAAFEIGNSLELFAHGLVGPRRSSCDQLAECLKMAERLKNFPPEDILQRLREGKPVIILTGYDEPGHGATALLWKDLLVLCDRKDAVGTVKIWRYDKKRLSADLIKKLPQVHKTEEEYNTFYHQALPTSLNAACSDNESRLQKALDIPQQIVKNCAWAAPEGIVKVFFLLFRLKESSFTLVEEEAAKLKTSTDLFFTSWLLFQRFKLLENYLTLEQHDDNLVIECLNSLSNAHTSNPQAFQIIEKPFAQLAKRYIESTTPQNRQLLRINEAWLTAHPPTITPTQMVDLLDTLKEKLTTSG